MNDLPENASNNLEKFLIGIRPFFFTQACLNDVPALHGRFPGQPIQVGLSELLFGGLS